jgi:predicted metal-dependent hydrolase
MKVVDEGHRYLLENVPDDEKPVVRAPQTIDFMKRVDGKMVAPHGTTNEEVLKMMIDRMQYLQKKLPCRENAIVITKLEESLMWLESRTQTRVEQGVETKDVSHK